MKYLFLTINLIITFTIINCTIEKDNDKSEKLNIEISRYVLGTHFNPSDNLILTEFNKFTNNTNGIVNNYPMCIYPEIHPDDPTLNGLDVNDPEGVLSHMEVIVNTWLPYLYNRWGFRVKNVHFKLVSTTQDGCPERHNGFRPFSVTSYIGGAYGGMAKRIRVRFPGKTINKFSDGTSIRQTILHEVGHVLGLMHTMNQSPTSVMDYDDMHNFNNIGGDDIVGMVHAWKFLSGQAPRNSCEFGYTGGPSCIPGNVNLPKHHIINNSTNKILQLSSNSNNAKILVTTSNGEKNQKFDIIQVDNGWRITSNISGYCMYSDDNSPGAGLKQTNCNESDRNQNFTLSKNLNETFMIINEGSGLVLTDDNGNLSQMPADGTKRQAWRITLVDDSDTGDDSDIDDDTADDNTDYDDVDSLIELLGCGS